MDKTDATRLLMGVLPVRQTGSGRAHASNQSDTQRKPRTVMQVSSTSTEQTGCVHRDRRRHRSRRHGRQRRAQRMTEPGAVQSVADGISIPARGREHEHQSVLESVARPIQSLLLSQGCPYRNSGIADPGFKMLPAFSHGAPPVRNSESTQAPTPRRIA